MPTKIKKVLNRVRLLKLSEEDAVKALSIFNPIHLLNEINIVNTMINKNNNNLIILAIDSICGGWDSLSKEANNETKNTRRT